ncbi:hypothetical protein JF541_08950 [Marinobacter hydrocarbonoclasticus]|uniref:hypothetical protein n=1 Tax=Marinobacter nauticus TaxID=2743 RepID=UPI001608CA9B|nr:hypothetical protein [Marinobacter nauticus]MBN8239269.1 hypothetical protein [Marinobacter nauticus]
MTELLQSVLDFWIDIILFVPRIIFWAALSLLETGLGMLPALDIIDPQSLASGFTGDMLYFLTIMEFDYGLGAISSALVARFLLRRIPFIG